MSVDNALSVVVVILSFTGFANTLSNCVTTTPCSCTLSNGQGFDLTNLIEPQRFLRSSTLSNRTFLFHPCQDAPYSPEIKPAENNCSSGVSLCLFNVTSNSYENIGNALETQIAFEGDLPQINIHHRLKDGTINTATISLFCYPGSSMPMIFEEYNTTKPIASRYNLFLISPHACLKPMHVGGLSTGSILVIIFLVFSGIYFIGGALSLKLLRGATGWEMLPNHKFWCDLPALVRDGIVFASNGCKTVSYDQI